MSQESLGERGLRGVLRSLLGSGASEGEGLECWATEEVRSWENADAPPSAGLKLGRWVGGGKGVPPFPGKASCEALKNIHRAKRRQRGRGKSPELVHVEVGRKR